MACAPVPSAPVQTAPAEATASPEAKPPPPPSPSIHAGSCHTCTLDAEGRVACWGCNGNGQLGDGAREDRATPVMVEGMGPVTQVAVGSASSYAIDRNGGVWCWGANEQGRCGRAGEDALRPVMLSSFEGATRVTAGETSACALTKERQLWCWGEDRYRRFAGAGSWPVRVDEALHAEMAELAEVVDVRADAGGNTCVLDADGVVICWGSDLGDWDSSDLPSNATPEERHQDFLSWGGPSVVARDVVGFMSHTWPVCVWKGPADAARWECLHGRGQEPKPMPGAPLDARRGGPQLALSWHYGCAAESGRVRCWGDEEHLRAASTAASLDDVVQVAIGGRHTCALRQEGVINCWGDERHFATGDATMAMAMPAAPAPKESARRRLALHGIVDLVAENTEQPCAIEQGGTVRCLVDGGWRRVPGLRNVVELSAGDTHACARTSSGAVQCWGEWYFGPYNHDGDDSDFLNRGRPRRIAGLKARAIESWGETDCALAMDGSVRCWGRHWGKSLVPRRMTEAPGMADMVDISMSARWDCGIDAAGVARCWASGDDMSGTPELELDDVAEISLAGDRGCARHRSGTVSCWGEAPVGDATWSARATPAAVVGLGDVVALSVGITHACARTTEDGEVRCWGENDQGQLGDGTARARIEPTLTTITHDLGRLAGVGVMSWQPNQTTLVSHTATVVWTDGGDVWMWGEQP